LQTLESSTKSKHFFSTRVKALSIAYDIHDFEWTARILSFCDGVEMLTIWAIPSHHHHHPDHHHNRTLEDNNLGIHRFKDDFISRSHHVQLQPKPHFHDNHYNILHDTLHHLRPKHLVLLIDEPIYHSTQIGVAPDFSLGLFSNLTHLCITNRWTEWTTWSWNTTSPSLPHCHEEDDTLISTYIPNFIPKLTHLSLEIQVGKWQISSSSSKIPSTSNSPRNHQKLVENVGLTLSTILTNSQLSSHLAILLCVLSFDQHPNITARMIKEQTNHHLGMQVSQYHSINDSRLVFVYDREPFSEREAGSSKVYGMWKNAEERVRLSCRDPAVDSQCTMFI